MNSVRASCLWVAHASRVLAMASRQRELSLELEITRKDRFSEDAETNTRDACATRSAACPRPLNDAQSSGERISIRRRICLAPVGGVDRPIESPAIYQ